MYIRRKFLDVNKIIPLFSLNELNKVVLKSLLSSSDFPFIDRFYFFYLLQKYSAEGSLSIFRRFCSVNGYSKSIFRLFKMSRHSSKRFASLGLLVGMRKSSF